MFSLQSLPVDGLPGLSCWAICSGPIPGFCLYGCNGVHLQWWIVVVQPVDWIATVLDPTLLGFFGCNGFPGADIKALCVS
jgi:hypothetical protein